MASLSSVVSDLVRAQMGTSLSSSVTDEELDRHVAELIVKEAKKKAELYMQSGIRAYTNNNLIDNNAPRANKRFLSSIIKSTDEHNKTVLKAQTQAAEDLKRERRDQERRQRKVRAEEAAAAERLRRHGKRRLSDEDVGWDRWDGRTAERRNASRNRGTWDGYGDDPDSNSDRNQTKKRRRPRSRDKVKPSKSNRSRVGGEERRSRHSTSSDREHSPLRRKRSPEHKRDDHQRMRRPNRDDTRTHSHRSEGCSRSSSSRSSDIEDHKSKKRKRSRSPKYALDDLRQPSNPELSRHSPVEVDIQAGAREVDLNQSLKASRKEEMQPKTKSGPLHDLSYSKLGLTPTTIPRSPRPPEQVPSKMDRYFEESYDPRLDVEPLALPQVPATGLVSDADFEGWDAMLELIRLRREDKVEKKRLERLGILPAKDRARKTVSTSSSAAVAERWNVDGASVMNIEYNKKGTVREWDLGKDGF